jgi:hypothetical protein
MVDAPGLAPPGSAAGIDQAAGVGERGALGLDRTNASAVALAIPTPTDAVTRTGGGSGFGGRRFGGRALLATPLSRIA